FDTNAIRMLLKADKLSARAKVSTDQQHWQDLGEIEAFADLVDNSSPAGPPPLFGRSSSGGTVLGHGGASGTDDAPGADRALGFGWAAASGAAVPPRPTLKARGTSQQTLPRPAPANLPQPAPAASLPRPSGRNLPGLKSRLSTVKANL